MDCRILRQLMLKADGDLACDDSNGYFIHLGQVSTAPGWSISQVLGGGVYAHVRRAFQEGRAPWPGICETCDLYTRDAAPNDTLNHKLRIMVEPTLACHLACPTCKRVQEGNRRAGNWNLEPDVLRALLSSCIQTSLRIDEIQYLGWGEPLLHRNFSSLTNIAKEFAGSARQEVTTTGNVELHEGLSGANLDKIVISCDGVYQESYAKFRRNGDLSVVFNFMAKAKRIFGTNTLVEWKYIVFDHNDTDEELLQTQALAEQFEIDSLLFILTNSKNKSQRFSVADIENFPIASKIASVLPAAAILKTAWTGTIKEHLSNLGKGRFSTLYVDRCTVSENNILVLEGWSLGVDLSRVEEVELSIGNRVRAKAFTSHPREDVGRALGDARAINCGFLMGVPIEQVSQAEVLLFSVKTSAGADSFRAVFDFAQHRQLE